ncbi:hypothetical protein XA68_16915 [Ophiocordyceps unilateralis]|uniref:NADH dehydrogenase [ubiquinone] 1 alpha subcomplex subunit 1 n=1 Tax=Ophiocordyceps unilateralis TaxID=268505 RepID=A0A2A9P5N9_OPHUN|nr:hypothetical protein XA68_16915 [Ophiocordyceps unilateralis]
MTGMFGVTGVGLAFIKKYQNEGKRPRYSLDAWDRQSTTPISLCAPRLRLTSLNPVMARDRRLTGTVRGQTNEPEAPKAFAYSNGWKMEERIC